jgi:hypothetical protein
MERKRAIKDKRYEDKHREQRKAKSAIWGTSVPKEKADEINEFLKRYGFTKVRLIEEGYKVLIDKAAENGLDLAKIMDGYDDFFGFEFEKSTKNNKTK